MRRRTILLAGLLLLCGCEVFIPVVIAGMVVVPIVGVALLSPGRHTEVSQLKLQTLRRGDISLIRSPRSLVIREAGTWQQIWREHAPQEAPPQVDFSRQMVLAHFMGSQPAGEPPAAAEILELYQERTDKKGETVAESLVAILLETLPGPPGGTATAPFHFALADKSDKPVRFVKANDSAGVNSIRESLRR